MALKGSRVKNMIGLEKVGIRVTISKRHFHCSQKVQDRYFLEERPLKTEHGSTVMNPKNFNS